MNLHRLRCFLMVAEELHFRRAAERLHMTQPPVSLAVKKLEESLGVMLFLRHNRKVSLTPAGRALKERGRELMEHVQRVETEVKQIGQGLSGSLSIGFVGMATALGLSSLVARFHQSVPSVSISLDEMPNHISIDRLHRGELDIGIVRGVPPDPLDYLPFVSEPYWAALPVDHPLACQDEIRITDLDEQPILFFPRQFQPELYDSWIQAFRNANVTPRVAQEIRSLGVELGLVAAGVGIALVARTLSLQERDGMVYRPLIGECPRVELNLAWHPDRFHETVERFIEMNADFSQSRVGH